MEVSDDGGLMGLSGPGIREGDDRGSTSLRAATVTQSREVVSICSFSSFRLC